MDALFPAGAKARAVELVRVGWLLARRLQTLVGETGQVEMGPAPVRASKPPP